MLGVTVADDIVRFLRRRPGLTEREIARSLFNAEGYHHGVNFSCRNLCRIGDIERLREGGPSATWLRMAENWQRLAENADRRAGAIHVDVDRLTDQDTPPA